MYISLWVLIPVIIVVILGARESWKNSTELDLLKADKEHDRRELEELRAELRAAKNKISRAWSCFHELRYSYFEGEDSAEATEHFRVKVRQAADYFEDDSKGTEDAPWR